VIGRKGSFGKVNFSPDPVFAIDTTFFVDDRFSAADMRWLFYLLGWLRLDEVSKDSAVPGLDREDAYQRMAAFPSLLEQAAIVRYLDYMDRRIRRYIRAKQKLIKLLEEQKQAIIHRAVTRGLDPNVRLKASGFDWIGEVPEHWEILKLKQLSHRISGRLVYQPAQYFSDEGVPFLMANNITPDGISWIDVKRIPEEVNARFAGCALRAGDVVTVRVGAPGVTCVVPREADGLNCGSLMIIRRSARFNPSWLAYVMNGMLFRHQIALVQYGAAQKQFNITDAVNFLVPTPPREEQDKIADWADTESRPLDAAIRATRRQIGVIREYRTRLIADVVTGKLDVREAAARLPDEVEEPEPLDEDEAEGGADGVADDADAAPEAEA
jgi:type I restriction enzyme S subunit